MNNDNMTKYNELINDVSNNRNKLNTILETISKFREKIDDLIPFEDKEKPDFRNKGYNKFKMQENMKTVTEILKAELDVRKTIENSIKTEFDLRNKLDNMIMMEESDDDELDYEKLNALEKKEILMESKEEEFSFDE